MVLKYRVLPEDERNLERSSLPGFREIYRAAGNRYANLLVSVIDEKDFSNWQAFLLRFYRIVGSPEGIKFFQSPFFSHEEKERLFPANFFDRPGQREFLCYLIKHRELYLLPNILVSFRSCFLKHHRIVLAKILSPVYLTEKQLEKLQTKLESRCGKRVVLQNYLDSSIIGGIIIYLDGKRVDFTVGERLRRLKQYLLENESCWI